MDNLEAILGAMEDGLLLVSLSGGEKLHQGVRVALGCSPNKERTGYRFHLYFEREHDQAGIFLDDGKTASLSPELAEEVLGPIGVRELVLASFKAPGLEVDQFLAALAFGKAYGMVHVQRRGQQYAFELRLGDTVMEGIDAGNTLNRFFQRPAEKSTTRGARRIS